MRLLALILMTTTALASSREENPRATGFEALGRSVLYGVFHDHAHGDRWAFGAGLARIVTESDSASALIPIYANYYFAPDDSAFFATGGLDILTADLDGESPVLGNTKFLPLPVAPVIGAGYEIRQSAGFLFRANAYLAISRRIAPSAGFSLAYSY
jgi:hypothetical protein